MSETIPFCLISLTDILCISYGYSDYDNHAELKWLEYYNTVHQAHFGTPDIGITNHQAYLKNRGADHHILYRSFDIGTLITTLYIGALISGH